MDRVYYALYSSSLKKDTHLLIYGDKGVPILVFPTQDAMCDNFENFGMIDTLSDLISSGQIRLFCVDSVDAESWSAKYRDNSERATRQEQYYHYIVDEVVPFIHSYSLFEHPFLTCGCSMGANHASISILRRPDLFQGCICMSGAYDATYFPNISMNSLWYENSPVHFLSNMPPSHSYIKLYNQRELIFCCGQGAWETEAIRTTRILSNIFREKGINAWTDFWGYDVNHDWPWWKKQIIYFLPFALASYNL